MSGARRESDARPRSRAPPSTCAPASSSRSRPRPSTASARTPAVRTPCAVIFAAKGRPADHPVIVHLYDASQLAEWARTVPDGARRLAAAFWPGPLTLILPRASRVADVVTGGQDSVGLRVPSHPGRARAARGVRRRHRGAVGEPLRPHLADHGAARRRRSRRAVAMILDGGACSVGIESTIVAFDGNEAALLRPGAIGVSELARVLGRVPGLPGASAPRASGTLASHYAPRTPATLVAPRVLHAEIEQLVERDEDVAVLARTVARPVDFSGTWIHAPVAAAAYAHDLYANLRALDAANADAILIEAVPDGDGWLAVRDRLSRATRGEDDDRD